MAVEQKGFCVRILEKEFRIACPEEQEQALQDAASFLDNQMAQIRQSGKAVGIERIAVVAALNIAFELLSLKNKNDQESQEMDMRLALLQNKIEGALEKHAPRKVSKLY